MCHKYFFHIFYQFFILHIIPMYSVPPPPFPLSRPIYVFCCILPPLPPPPVQSVQTICVIPTVIKSNVACTL